jgi:hypothetical protein
MNLLIARHIENMAHAFLPGDTEYNKEQGSAASYQSLSVALNDNEQGDGANIDSDVLISKWDPRRFECLHTLGKGHHATIYLVKSSQTKELYAMKVRSKRLIQISTEIKSISTEKEILLLAKRGKHPFIVEVFGGFQTQSHTMLYLEFCQGGDLMQNLHSSAPFGIERTS